MLGNIKAHGAERIVKIVDFGHGDKVGSPCGIALQANNSTSVELVFHGASRKGAKDAKSGKIIFLCELSSAKG